MTKIIQWKGEEERHFFFDNTNIQPAVSDKTFLFSMVIAMYNAEEFITETLESIINQTIGFEDYIQIVIVDDGSSDRSFDICKRYAERYPNNIVLVRKTNGGVSSARNVGMKFVQGKYINFIDSDDKWSLNVCEKVAAFYNKYENQVDVVTVKNELFGNLKGNSWFNKKFEKGTRLINLWKEPKVYLNSTNSSFFHTRIKNQLYFDEQISISEDLKVVNSVLMNKYALGVISDALYYYRIRGGETGSLAAGARKKNDWYFPYLERVFFWLYNKSMKQCGFFIPFLQHTLMRDLYNRFNNNTDCLNVVGDRIDEYTKLLKKALSVIDDAVIFASDYLNTDYQVYLFSQKYGTPFVSSENGKAIFEWDNRRVKVVKSLYICYERVDVKDEKAYIEGYFVANNFGESTKSLKLNLRAGDALFDVKLISNTSINSVAYANKNIFERKFFVASINLDDFVGGALQAEVIYNGNVLPYTCVGFGRWFPIRKNAICQYYYKDSLLMEYQNDTLFVRKGNDRDAKRFEKKRIKELKRLAKTDIVAKRGYRYRLIYKFFNLLFPLRRPIWIISDRYMKAGDNGEAFYDYLRHKRRVNAFFAIAGNVPDYKRLKDCGYKVLDIYSKRYKLYYLISDVLVSAHFDSLELLPCDGTHIGDIISKKKYVFLQHGITKDNMSSFYSRKAQNLDIFVTAATPEYNSIISIPDYFCNDSVAKLTGFPRYDKLINNPKKRILFMPTWRKSLFVGTGVKAQAYEQTYYFRFWTELLTDEELRKTAELYGYELWFFPHFNMAAYEDHFLNLPSIIVPPMSERDYTKVFSESSVMVTDYSSTAFDFAYLRKPVVYCQGDNVEFFSGHTYTKGYYDYEKDGFGEVVYNVRDAVKAIINLIKNDCSLDEKYAERIDRFFPFSDRKNSERVYNEIIRL